MHSLEYDIKRILLNHQLVEAGEPLIVAVSGGPDSMALLHILAFLQKELQYLPVAVYVDHGLRPDETDAEWACVGAAATALGLDCEYVPVDTEDLVRSRRISIEHAARELRYRALRRCARKYEASRIAVAHTADDQVEELLLRLLRGSGRKGLAGMRLQNRDIIRPLLTTTKERLTAWLVEHNLVFRQDSSNDDLRFSRNRIRHILLPLLEGDFDPGIRKALLKTAANLSEDEDYLELLVQEVWPQVIRVEAEAEGEPIHVLDRAAFAALHPCLQRRLVERLLWKLGSPARYQHIMAVLQAGSSGRTGSELHLSKGLRVGVARNVLEFSYPRGKRSWRGRLRNSA
ncbi:MAG TPA: tRNA lysidine(34) synthetase TilS [Desulfobulbus sp.]|nr:tRNA lysidine(34) synthetase TilS [Desulfobulbus sp.]